MQTKLMACCGVRELHGLSSYYGNNKAALLGFIHSATPYMGQRPIGWQPREFSFGAVIFTGVKNTRYCAKLARYIKENNLGKVTRTPLFYNPNSGNHVRIYTWFIDRVKLQEWYDNNKGV